MQSKSVDEFVQAKVLPQFHPVVAMLRELMAECAPQAEEIISYGIPAYRVKRIIAVISPTQKDITFAFSRGAEMEDKHGLLRGVGKVSRHVKLKSPDSVEEVALRDYIRQALELEAR
jgi:hypothetical protein